MHEATIAMNIMEIVQEQCLLAGIKKVSAIKVQIGRNSGVVKHSLTFAFNTMKHKTQADQAKLVIEDIPVSGWCNTCNRDFSVEKSYILFCPICGLSDFILKGGNELNVVEIEGE